MLSNILFYLFIISTIILGSISIGPFSLRVYMTIIIILLLIMKRTRFSMNRNNKYMCVYILYLFFYGVSLINNGEFETHNYIKQIMAYHLVCITIFYSCQFFITTSNVLKITNTCIIGVLFLTSVVTILQYIGNPLGWSIALFFNNNGIPDVINEYSASNNYLGNNLGKSITVGLFPYVFTNAMFISSTGVVPLFGYFYKKNSLIIRILYLLITLLAVIACFMTQQRAAFGLLLFGIIMSFIRFGSKKIVIFLLFSLFIISICGINLTTVVAEDNIGRIGTMLDFKGDISRNMLRKEAIQFIKNNLLWGGPESFKFIAGNSAHNFFLNAFIYGGLFGGISVVVMFIMMLQRVLLVIYKAKSLNLSFFYSIGLLAFFLCGFFHNASIVIGSSQIFILFSLMLVADYLENINTNYGNMYHFT